MTIIISLLSEHCGSSYTRAATVLRCGALSALLAVLMGSSLLPCFQRTVAPPTPTPPRSSGVGYFLG